MDSNVTQNWLALAALLAGIGALVYSVLHGKAEIKVDGQRQYVEKLERIMEQQNKMQHEMVEALRAMTEEMRRTREEQLAMDRNNVEMVQGGFREIREVLWRRQEP